VWKNFRSINTFPQLICGKQVFQITGFDKVTKPVFFECGNQETTGCGDMLATSNDVFLKNTILLQIGKEL
jgi:hypothetical protein